VVFLPSFHGCVIRLNLFLRILYIVLHSDLLVMSLIYEYHAAICDRCL
jgi:hypothetical protein